MPTTAPAYTLLVEVDGQALPADIAGLLAGGYVDNSSNVPDLFVLHFSDGAGTVVAKGHFTIGGTVKVSVQPTSSTPPQELLTGEITALETEVDFAGKHLVVRGMDKSHRLFRGRRVAAYVNMKATDIAAQLAQGAGLQVGEMTSKGVVFEHVSQPGISDWDFLAGLAHDIGAELIVEKGALSMRDPQDCAAAPSSSADADRVPQMIEFGKNLQSLRSTVTAAEQVPRVEVRGWDPKAKDVVVGSAQAGTRSATLGAAQPSAFADTFASQPWVEADSRLAVQTQAQNRADAVAERLAGTFAELDGTAVGNPELRAGTAVALAGLGDPFDGKYTLSSTRHEFSPDTGYRTAFSVSNVSDRSLYGVGTGAASADRMPVTDGVLTAIVTDVQDPDQLFRVKVKVPVLADTFESGWARVLQTGAGDKRGQLCLPEVGDEVLVAFGMGQVDEPYVLGGVFNGTDLPDKPFGEHVDSAGAVQRRALVGRTGMLVELVEKSSETYLAVATQDGQQVKLVQDGDRSITIEAGGPVNVKAGQNVTVTATGDVAVSTASGSVSLSGASVSIDATSDLELSGANVTIAASAAAKLSGNATAELSSSGATTVAGTIVKIN